MNTQPLPESASPFQNIPVPNEHVPAVLTYLGSLLSNKAHPVVPERASTPEPPAEGDDEWTDEELARFFAIGTKYSEITHRMLDYLAEHPGKELGVSTQELSRELDVKYSEMKILPTQVRRTLRTHFPGMAPPWSAIWGPDDIPARGDEVYFWVTQERANQVKRLAGK